jgi:hypothetical protein
MDNITIDVTVGQQINAIENKITLYPNPAHSVLTIINSNSNDTYNCIIYNLAGEKVLETKQLNAIQNIAIDALQSGLYTLQVIGVNGIKNIKFIKQ